VDIFVILFKGMKNEKYYTDRTIPKTNIKIVERDTIIP
jgi:hypothetical protein